MGNYFRYNKTHLLRKSKALQKYYFCVRGDTVKLVISIPVDQLNLRQKVLKYEAWLSSESGNILFRDGQENFKFTIVMYVLYT